MKKKAAKKSKAKGVSASSREIFASLKKTVAAQAQQIREAAEQQAGTSEVLRLIASSPTDIQPVLDTVAKNAARLCEATDAVITRAAGESVKQVAQFGAIPVPEPQPHQSPLARQPRYSRQKNNSRARPAGTN